jgi:hypothetical protein
MTGLWQVRFRVSSEGSRNCRSLGFARDDKGKGIGSIKERLLDRGVFTTNHSPYKSRPLLCHPERSRGICSSADLHWKCFSTKRSGGCGKK